MTRNPFDNLPASQIDELEANGQVSDTNQTPTTSDVEELLAWMQTHFAGLENGSSTNNVLCITLTGNPSHPHDTHPADS